MNTYKIIANGTDMGNYEAENEGAAIEAAVNDAGYGTIEEAAEVCGQTEEEFLVAIQAEEVAV